MAGSNHTPIKPVHRARLDNIAVVLHRPHFPENIGAVARACKNMGIFHLIVVDPLDCDLTRILKMATHASEDVVANMEVYDDLAEALGPFNYIVGTTARRGSQRRTVMNPREVARELIPISQNNRIALLFGPENRGLANRELKLCHTLVTIPTSEFASLNLAQAVMIMLYEIFTASAEFPPDFVPRLASSFELEAMYDHLSRTLAKIHFINPENPEYWMMNIRRFFSRMQLRARDVKIIRGICRQIEWYCEERVERLLREAGVNRVDPEGDCEDRFFGGE
ncbi:RNA methyltransferase [Thermodesulforhabdus norvegica]|uniref:tRNA (cytidine/uridine-2'-O-)-methyltransferase TrmJ n=1 Tax=Thermodesulforhabdus norvegica TaxID=39841 RepID=A0A1I4VT52_9BACT|nr:RNA methyltransferase [Thermodesulforhabdus norvegica]SFN04352.1 tRNA/rRNA methyltransferase [Thermodesulforhabdus norvegica]